MMFLLCLPSFGCVHIVAPEAPIQKPPLVQAIPLTIGVYYPEELQKYECETGKGYIFEKYGFRLGPASIKLYDLVFSGLFARSLRVNRLHPSVSEDKNVDVIELMITSFTGCEAKWPIFGTTYISITYKAILRLSSGEKIAEWTGTGQATPSEGGAFGIEEKYLENLTALAMRRAAADFVRAFQENQDITAWLEKGGAVRSNP